MGITVLIGEENSRKSWYARHVADELNLEAVFDSGDFEKDLENAKRTITDMWIKKQDGKPIQNPLYGKNVLVITNRPFEMTPDYRRIDTVIHWRTFAKEHGYDHSTN